MTRPVKHIVLYFVLISLAMANVKIPPLPRQERFFDGYGWVHIIIRDLNTLFYSAPGCWECRSKMHRMSQEDYLKLIAEEAPIGDKLNLLAQLGRYWVGPDQPWKAMNITEEQWKYWLLTGTLKTQEELDASKASTQAANVSKESENIDTKQVAAAMAEISAIKYYIKPGTGVWHVDPNCPDNVGCIAVNPFDILKYENRKQCSLCGVK